MSLFMHANYSSINFILFLLSLLCFVKLHSHLFMYVYVCKTLLFIFWVSEDSFKFESKKTLMTLSLFLSLRWLLQKKKLYLLVLEDSYKCFFTFDSSRTLSNIFESWRTLINFSLFLSFIRLLQTFLYFLVSNDSHKCDFCKILFIFFTS